MDDKTKPSDLSVWLGLADNTFTRQKTVKFGDATAVNSGRFYSILAVAACLAAWIVASVFELVEPFYWPSIDGTWDRLVKIASEGFRNVALWDHIGISVYRVLSGVFYGTLVGVPLGFAMGLSSTGRGLFDPIVEFMRPIPPLALIPLVILWFGIDEFAKIFLLFLASLFIMTIAPGRASPACASPRCTRPTPSAPRSSRSCGTSSCPTPFRRSSRASGPRWACAGVRSWRRNWSPPTGAWAP